MKRVKQLNKWTIKKLTEKDPNFNYVDDNKNYVVISPNGTVMEDRLTLSEAEEFCLENKDFIEQKELSPNQQLIKEVKDGKWFSDKYGDAIKIKSLGNSIVCLWLSKTDPEIMSFREMEESDFSWNPLERTMTRFRASTNHFGLNEMGKDNQDDIYSEEGEILVENMKRIILESYENKTFKLVTEEELNEIWSKIENQENLDFPIFHFK